jgi:hypothetical protein
MSLTCRGCGKTITGRYITALGATWHEVCFKCAKCGKSLVGQQFYEKNGQPYHETCYHALFSPRCAGCGQPITGQYITALGKTWHPEHFVCARCGKPFGSEGYYERDGKPYCRRDYDELFGLRCAAGGELIGQQKYYMEGGKPYCEKHYWELFGKRCVIGGEILKGEYQYNSWGDTYCKQHADQTPMCYSCNRPICSQATGGGVRYGDGRTVCNICRRTAIDGDAAAQSVLDDVRRGLPGCGIIVPGAVITAKVVDQNELARRETRSGKPPTGLTLTQKQVMSGGRELSRRIEGVLILHGLPREHFEAVAAHELMHCYLFLDGFPELPRRDEEGLAELAEWLWLKQKTSQLAGQLAKATESGDDAIYGAGFQVARAGYERMGLARLLAQVKKNGRLP